MQRFMLYLSGSVFLLVAVAHTVRMAMGLQVVIQEWIVPLWLSGPAAVGAVVLCWLCFKAAGR